jgi:hypothetical protein
MSDSRAKQPTTWLGLAAVVMLAIFAPEALQGSGTEVALESSAAVVVAPPPAQRVQEEAPPERRGPRDTPVVCGLDPYVSGPDDGELTALAKELRLEEPRAFVSVVNTLETTGRLPDCYLDKREASSTGWSRGQDLWKVEPGTAIGGDHFGNYEGHLPKSGRYTEADLDYDGGRRGPVRLVFSDPQDGVWVTVDHYDHFVKVP